MTDTSTPIPAAQLREWREACERATFAPWGIERTSDTNWIGPMRTNGDGKINIIVVSTDRDGLTEAALQQNDADADFIALARTALPRLLDAYDSAQREIAAKDAEIRALRTALQPIDAEAEFAASTPEPMSDEEIQRTVDFCKTRATQDLQTELRNAREQIAALREERDDALELAETRAVALDDLAHKMEYRGNSVSYIYDKKNAYGLQIKQLLIERDAALYQEQVSAAREMRLREVLLDLREILTGSNDYREYYSDEIAQIDAALTPALRERTAELDARDAQGSEIA